MPSTLRCETDGPVLTITLARPERLNAFDGTMADELIAAFDAADADDAVRAVIVTGEGRAFCAGADLAAAGSATFDIEARTGQAAAPGTHRDRGGLVTLRIFRCLKPVIAAINGPAVGIGATMLLPMDIRIASTAAKFGFVFTRRGIVPEACSSWFLPRVVGISQALEWTFSGRLFDAAEAQRGGLVREVVAPEALLPAAQALALEIAQQAAPVSVALTRQMMWRMLGAAHPMQAHRADSRGIAARGASADARGGVGAVLHTRPAEVTHPGARELPDLFPDRQEPPVRGRNRGAARWNTYTC
jgi:enoyl-CoA hydratase/carnithine racemase